MKQKMKDGTFAGGADGIRADVDGNIWAGAGWVGEGYDGVHIIAPDGQRIGQILLPEICSNVSFGGAKRNRLFMLELKNQGTPEDRFSFLLGAVIASDLDPLVARGIFTGDIQIVISGHGLIAEAWAYAFRLMAIRAVVLTKEQTEKAFLTGLASICAQSGVAQLVVRGKNGEPN